ncbi:hypothetical protein MXB_790 [Myxobolus squamalis]|nr:hypothetical protein MXB_790 [Myxobolus squamalis]
MPVYVYVVSLISLSFQGSVGVETTKKNSLFLPTKGAESPGN